MKRSNSSSNGVSISASTPCTPRRHSLVRSDSVPTGLDASYVKVKKHIDQGDITGAKGVLVDARPKLLIPIALKKNHWKVFVFLVKDSGCDFVACAMPIGVWEFVNEEFVKNLICYGYATKHEIGELLSMCHEFETPGLSSWLKTHMFNSGDKINLGRGKEE